MTSLRLAVLVTHPIQYFAPLYRELAGTAGVDLMVYFAHRPTAEEQGIGFGVAFEWDIDLTAGYPHLFLENRSRRPAVGFAGYDTPAITGILRRERFDALLVSGWNTRSYWQGITAAWRTGTPVLVRGDSQLEPRGRSLRRTLRSLAYPLFIRRFDACLSVGTRSAEYFRAYGARRVVPSPHFVDNDWFADRARHERQRRDELRRAWGIAEGAFVVLYAGKFVEKKRPLDVVRAVAADTGADVHALFVGDGELRGAVEGAAASANVRSTFAGFLNQGEIVRAYAAADALVLPSDFRETWGLVVNEALASGLPVIVADEVGCAPDLVVPGVTGYAYPTGDIARLASAIRLMASDRRATAAMGQQGARHVRAFSVERAAAGVISAARAASGRHGRGREASEPRAIPATGIEEIG